MEDGAGFRESALTEPLPDLPLLLECDEAEEEHESEDEDEEDEEEGDLDLGRFLLLSDMSLFELGLSGSFETRGAARSSQGSSTNSRRK